MEKYEIPSMRSTNTVSSEQNRRSEGYKNYHLWAFSFVSNGENTYINEKSVESEMMSGLAEKPTRKNEKGTLSPDFEFFALSGKEKVSAAHSRTTYPLHHKRNKENQMFSKDVRIAIYTSAHDIPEIFTIDYTPNHKDYIEKISHTTYELSQKFDTTIPYSVIKSLVENFIHADFAEPIISLLENGSVLKVSDQGSGITNPALALQHGFSTAQACHKAHIAGVGSGLPTAANYATSQGGSLYLEDNIAGGSVVTLDLTGRNGQAPLQNHNGTIELNAVDVLAQADSETEQAALDSYSIPPSPALRPAAKTRNLSERQQEVLVAVTDCGNIGPSQIAKLLEISVATAYRDLHCLEQQGYVCSKAGKRTVTKDGLLYLEKNVFGTNIYL